MDCNSSVGGMAVCGQGRARQSPTGFGLRAAGEASYRWASTVPSREHRPPSNPTDTPLSTQLQSTCPATPHLRPPLRPHSAHYHPTPSRPAASHLSSNPAPHHPDPATLIRPTVHHPIPSLSTVQPNALFLTSTSFPTQAHPTHHSPPHTTYKARMHGWR